jgi:hypothetical protein
LRECCCNPSLPFILISDLKELEHFVVWAGSGTTRKRHELFMSKKQRQLAGLAVAWFLDATYHMSPDGFMQLFTINGFIVAENGEFMQVPFAFVFMRSRRTVDYVEVINSVKNLLLSVSVQEVISDFESALKSAVKICFPSAHHFGCLFHTKQAMGRKANELGLTPAYRRQGTPERKYIQLVLCLPHLPAEKICGAFQQLRRQCPSSMDGYMDYVSRTWASENALFPPEMWSAFKRIIRTNNDVEGLHNRWNQKSKGQRGFYPILLCLAREAKLINVNMVLLSYGMLNRGQKTATRLKQQQIAVLEDAYLMNEMDSFKFLETCVVLLQVKSKC